LEQRKFADPVGELEEMVMDSPLFRAAVEAVQVVPPTDQLKLWPVQPVAPATEQLANWKLAEPSRAPLLHERYCRTEAQSPPNGTEVAENQKSPLPWVAVLPSRVQFEHPAAEQEALVKLPESVPLLHERDSLTQLLPQATEADWKAVTEAPWFTLLPLKVQLLAL
jgi:hypothetical protein